ncbi:hypothetical protein [Cryobacterium cryoconiti]|uniref:Uncharacterized protein n=1 Tax=Cryobacterium cryoconiti TaxID=1259239 RepID=A0A4Y8JUY5_9MICO|nr:hypothetical protein [Cryobacterium cryoconiti]TFD28252.1 hypothetical protein E3T49_12115 [Cryobacterium cryoconiti]
MLYLPAADDTRPAIAIVPTFDALLAGPADDDAETEEPVAASPYVWRTRAWLPPTKHQRKTDISVTKAGAIAKDTVTH